MIGLTISLAHQLQAADYNYLIALRNAGFNEVLATVKEKEKADEQIGQRLHELVKWCQNLDLNLILQGDAASFKQMDIDLADVGQVQTAGLKGVAVQRQVKSQMIAKLSKSLPVLVEAGKFTTAEIANLHADNANFNNLLALFPTFSVAKTALSLSWLKQKIAWLKKQGLKSAAFVPSNKKAAPTVEQQRGMNPLAAYLALKKAGCSQLFLAGQLNGEMITVFTNYLKQGQISLHLVSGAQNLMNSNWQTDPYVRQDIISLASSVQQTSLEGKIAGQNYGNIGIMTASSGQEMLISKTDSSLGPNFHFLAQIAENDFSLLPLIGPNQPLLFLPAK